MVKRATSTSRKTASVSSAVATKNRPIVVLDFGGQYTHLIARKIRFLGVYSHVLRHDATCDQLLSVNPAGIILSGSPHSVNDRSAPKLGCDIFSLQIPILGICYGLQYIISGFGGKVAVAKRREYGDVEIRLSASPLYRGLSSKVLVWMSHSEEVIEPPSGFRITGKSKTSIASIENSKKNIYCLQYHPEVHHSRQGVKIISNFVHIVCGQKSYWKMPHFIDEKVEEIKKAVGKRKVFLALSGGVDSSVLALLLSRALGRQLVPIFVDNGLLRNGEVQKVVETFRKRLKIDIVCEDASELFLKKLAGVRDPEQKRKIIGNLFVKVFFRHLKGDDMLAQGTLYTDVIESVSTLGPSTLIKTHHNRVKEILDLQKQGRLIEPFSTLFKDEVRKIGKELGLPDELLKRHPFPGPGLAVRILGAVTKERLTLLRAADEIFLDELKKHRLYEKLWQCFAVLLPIKSVGVVGDRRGYGATIALRAVDATDGMTADFHVFEKEFLSKVSNRIIGEVSGISRVVLDITSKPPATIEWE